MQINLSATSRPHKYNNQAELNRNVMASIFEKQERDYIVTKDGDCYLILDCLFIKEIGKIRQVLQDHGIKISKPTTAYELRLSTLPMTKQGWKEEDFKLLAEYIISLLKIKF